MHYANKSHARRYRSAARGKKIVWRCISRLDYGTKYCKKSPTLEEGAVQAALVKVFIYLATRPYCLQVRTKGAKLWSPSCGSTARTPHSIPSAGC
jgi:hypothetical protein